MSIADSGVVDLVSVTGITKGGWQECAKRFKKPVILRNEESLISVGSGGAEQSKRLEQESNNAVDANLPNQ